MTTMRNNTLVKYFCVAGAILRLSLRSGQADQIVAGKETKIQPFQGTQTLRRNVTVANATISAEFQFHPPWTTGDTFAKPQPGDPAAVTSYGYGGSGIEIHGTSGKVTHSITTQWVNTNNHDAGVRGIDIITANIKAGKNTDNPNTPVSIQATYKDPYTFSDTDPTSSFNAPAGGLSYSFGLLGGTSIPTADASAGSSASFLTRVAPGVIADPDQFFGQNLSGAVDILSLSLTLGLNNTIAANLVLGQSTPEFTLVFHNASGTIFDPTDPGVVAAIESSIAGSFVNGSLPSDLSDLIGVDIIPSSSTSEYSLGEATTIFDADIEVPEPGPLLLLVLGGAVGICRRIKSKVKGAVLTIDNRWWLG